MKNNDIAKSIEQQFGEIVDIILQHKSNASRVVNEELLLTAWHVGGYVSAKLRSEEWGSKVVSQLSEYIRSQRPDLKGYSKRSIYNMVMFYDEYSSETFIAAIKQYLNTEFVQTASAQIEAGNHVQESATIVQSMVTQIVQSTAGQMPKILELTTLSNHIEILCRCKSNEERIFYILYANKEHLSYKEMQRCISNQTYVGLLGNKDNMSKGLLERYPNAPILFKDTLFVDFLNLPKKHSESKLRNGLVEHMKQFILELGKDFIFMDQEYRLNIGTSTFKADLLFFHRCLQITEQISLVYAVLQHLLEAVLYGCNILMVGHAVPCIISLQNLHGHFPLLQQLTDENRNQILCFQRISWYFLLEKLFEALLQNIQKLWN